VAATLGSQKTLGPLSLFVTVLILSALALSAPPARAQTAPYTLYSSTIAYSTASGYTPQNVNFTWTNTDTCGTFTGEYPAAGPNEYDAPSAYWEYGSGVGATPCTASLPSGTITETISSDGTVLASCTDAQGAATFGNPLGKNPSYCTTAGTGVVIEYFNALAYDAAGNPIAAGSSGNDDWIIAVVVVIIILLLVFLYMRRKRSTSPEAAGAQRLAGEAEVETRKLAAGAEKEAKIAVDKVKGMLDRETTPAAAAAQAASVPPAAPPATAEARFCQNCGSPVPPNATFCTKCGKAL